MRSVDINCDMGESFGNFKIGNDEAVFPHITSCNIACGMHAGDPYHIEKTINMALEHNVQIGAHPGYPDLQGFGRRVLPIAKAELSSYIKYQISALQGMVKSAGGKLAYVKPHGALYNEIAKNETVARTVYSAIESIDPNLKIMGLAGSHVQQILDEMGLDYIPEAFADRYYEVDGKLRSRTLPNAVIQDPEVAASQVLSITVNNQTLSSGGQEVALKARSFCIHGDNPAAVNILTAIDKKLSASNIQKKAF
ncbi:5-oxoprolinase subunit PxpA [Roseivirga misakiensis]|uniref:5-oxoprolinase subunit A n=1 Tax=Roseivirga misakiensis TaxID=1563681 RepID=A0A1E5T180_9BACT|nr:5-oxoprolinase subunit PxpA [Roseivirga misakiensis]OEK05133.1 lactam utilization protein LamB [Roseivirga misakiensis]